MTIYTLIRTQFVPITALESWDFFSIANNLAHITPPSMGFKVEYMSGTGPIYAGQLIRYKVNILSWFTVTWLTEITHVHAPLFFVDEQRFGPYALWHHQHHFKTVEGGVEMIDEINYAIPLGFLGRIANTLFVKREVNRIFDFRARVLKEKINAAAAPQTEQKPQLL